MGTNYYWADLLEGLDDDKRYDRRHELDCHIGKRSASGHYCFDCRVSLCKEGEKHVHGLRHGEQVYGTIPHWKREEKRIAQELMTPAERFNAMMEEENKRWWEACPICKKKPKKESLDKSSAGRELGFNKSGYTELKGVCSCSSFSWGIEPHKVYRDLQKSRPIVDEYGRSMDTMEFVDMLYYICPIQFYDTIGICFS